MISKGVVTRCAGFVIPLLLSFISVLGQTQNIPPHLLRPPRNPDEAAYRQIQIQRTMEAQQRQAMREAEASARASATLPREKLPKLTEADRARIEALLTPNPEDVAANKHLLDQPRTGIFRLFPNSNCESRRQIRVDGDCANHIPGGSSYSFRAGGITPDIHFNNGNLIGEGFVSQILVAELGDLALADVNLSTAGIGFLKDFEPANDFDGAAKQRAGILKGIDSGERKYSNIVVPKIDTTYATRIVAYRNDNNLARRLPREGLAADNPVTSFQMVQADNRFDLLVAFRVIRREADGNLTILWKELTRKKSPVITFDRDQELADFK